MKKTKFYTPSIDELFDGVLFEEKIDNKWVARQYKAPLENVFNIRMKYLNEDDILDLQFEKALDTNLYTLYNKMNPSLNVNKMVYIKLNKLNKVPTISISSGDETVISNLIVKSKDELIWILNRLCLN
jgi:hypothetical protein